jgi:hypothetical protein
MVKFSQFKITYRPKNSLEWLILGLQGVSATTTMNGAAQIFPTLAGWIFGGTLQLILVFLLVLESAKESPIRRWSCALFVTLFSIYASFFCLYNELTLDIRNKEVYAQVSQQHAITEKAVYSPLKGELSELREELKVVNLAISKEENGDGETGIKGIGPKARNMKARRNALEEKIGKLEPHVEAIKISFEGSEKNLEDINEK